LVLTLLLGWAAFAEVPLPVHPDCAEDDLGACPNDLRGWEFTSWVPDNSKDSVRPVELDMGSGTGLDVAVQYSTGRWDVPIAILDSGIIWNESRIARKILINDGELPQPQHADGTLVADWDLDGNGLVNISDYAEDPRMDITAGVDSADGRLDASDLIHTF